MILRSVLKVLVLTAGISAFSVLVASPASAQETRVSGVVQVSTTQRPLAGAEILVAGTALQARTDSLGRFELVPVKPGRVQLVVRSLGHREHLRELEVPVHGVEGLVVLLEPITELQRVETRADPLAGKPNLRAFEERKKFGTGRFLDSTQLGYPDPLLWNTLLTQRIPGLRQIAVGSKRVYASSRGAVSINQMPRGDMIDRGNRAPVACYIAIIVDGIRLYSSGPDETLLDINRMGLGRVLAAEYYSVSQLPPEFNRSGTAPCGTLVLWTQY
ncbi:MAG TPA: carboxypeptidase-like regulatory domain-containing protein [Gemmatimonas aurantiaca]|uniref:Carboxypeptidase-like regulatory domain-containing protein n=2 Tax=Gemmatimonas aurantiaca TaxID=173480 RepID=C1AC51_GEMAT|nr:carboxypeptidase regulatory-like domain-containing protein [Gemmatimonas aurantiaca]BAH40078.1 hypothetical protein GAU_3036 [Gemmatimonas aurantiaca T-27]HCT57914.1 carboxypeptidase-like regulatory domain-containing protein [Gemmatimonas aurantiaca]